MRLVHSRYVSDIVVIENLIKLGPDSLIHCHLFLWQVCILDLGTKKATEVYQGPVIDISASRPLEFLLFFWQLEL